MKFICQSVPDNVLTDGHLTCQYRDIPRLFAQLQDFFLQKGISAQQGVVLECENSLPSALVLLFLFEYGYCFLLSKPENSSQTPPAMCGYQLKINPISLNPDEFLTVIAQTEQTSQPVDVEPKFYLRTSGSTGVPKIIVHTHAKMRGNAVMCVQRLGLTAQNRIALTVPISHLFGLGAGFLPAISVGASIDLQKSANIIRYLQREKEFNPNTVLMTPIFCETLLKGRKSPRPYQLTVVAGDRLREGVFSQYEALFGCLVQLYGSTEMGAIAAGNPQDSSELRSLAIGLPMTDVQIRIDPPADDVSEHHKDSGEICCNRQYSFIECWDNQAQPLDLAQIKPDGWFATRDLGRILPNGYIEVLGRCDHSIKRDGLLVLFADVEAALQSIIARGESLRGKGLWAYCVVNDNTIDNATIRSRCFDLLPKRAVPDYVIILEALPLLSNGKIDRQSLLTISNDT
jgi:acyl-CoA synthetase (AMP-forming)/AMP-acid ligase II